MNSAGWSPQPRPTHNAPGIGDVLKGIYANLPTLIDTYALLFHPGAMRLTWCRKSCYNEKSILRDFKYRLQSRNDE